MAQNNHNNYKNIEGVILGCTEHYTFGFKY